MSKSDAAARTIRQLLNFGFPEDKVREAVDSIGDPADSEAAMNWLLDHGEEDKGGAVEFKHCPHISDMGYEALLKPNQLTFGRPCLHGCQGNENWICLLCGETRCGRYAKKHNLAHWQETRNEEEARLTVAEAASGRRALGHCLAIGLQDLSVWCYQCGAYVQHEHLKPLLQRMEKLKFPDAADSNSAGPSTSATPPLAGSALSAKTTEMHGRMGDAAWAAPQLARACEEAARPGYRTRKAHEYLDSPGVLEAKVAMLARLVRESKQCVAYTGAGISTASGISDYATKASGSIAQAGVRKTSAWEAQPTLAHHALVALYRAGHLKHWVQQNHDGLPQKAGYPQHELNEIHGAWYDPSNPVVPMDGTLRSDLIQWMLEWEERADLCLALGTSMVGMNADRMAVTTAQKAKHGKGLGTVIVALQQTQYDSEASLRIFAPIDRVMELLAKELALYVPSASTTAVEQGAHSHMFKDLPYDSDGKLSMSERLTLDLREGSRLRIVNQQDWDKAKHGSVGAVISTQDSLKTEGHYAIRMGCESGPLRILGRWWLEAAKEGKVPSIPIVPCHI